MASSYKEKGIEIRTRLLHKLTGQLISTEKPVLFTGPGASIQMCQVLPYHGHKKAMILTDNILFELGVIDPIKKALEENGIEVALFHEVEPDPTDVVVERAKKIFLDQGCDCVIAVGGGSSIDAAKAVATLATNSKLRVKDMAMPWKIRKLPKNIYCIPTTSGTGSEVSVGSVISDHRTHEKTIITAPGMMPLAAAIDTNIIKGMPPSVTAFTGLDALTHAIEAYISKSASRESDHYSRAAVKMVMENLPKAYHDGDDLKARELMGIAAFYAGYAFSKALLGYTHSISHRLSKHYGTPHGLANAMVLPHVLDYSKDAVTERLAKLARDIGEGTAGSRDEELAQLFIDRVYALNEELGIPPKLDKLEPSHIPEIAEAALAEAHFIYAVPKYMDKEECEKVVRKLLPAA